jgi:hypothetical protein
MNAGEFSRGAREAENAMGRLASRAQHMASAMAGSFAAIALGSFVTMAVRAFGQSETAIAQVEAAVRSTGGTAGFTTERLVAMAQQLKALSAIDDEVILKELTANLLTFANIVGPVFEEAQVAALNLSARLGQDLKSSSIQLGKALNDPINGLTALRRVGVAFTESQKEQIKTMVQSGNIMGAQRMILAELGKEFGGQAEAAARSVEGKLNAAIVAFGDAMEHVGAALAPIFIPVIESLAELSKWIAEASPKLVQFGVVAASVSVSLGLAAGAVGIFAAALGAAAAPIALVVAGIGAVVAALTVFWPEVKQAAAAVEAGFAAMYNSAVEWLVNKLGPILKWFADAILDLGVPFETIGQHFGVLGEKIAASGPAAVEAARKVAADMSTAVQEELAAGAMAAGPAPALTTEQAVANVQKNAVAEAAAQAQVEAAKKAHSEAQAELNKQINEGLAIAKNLETPRETELRQLAALDAAYKKGKISAEALGKAQVAVAATAINAYAGLAANVASSLAQLFNKSKGVAIASALINTFEAVTKALASYPPPFSYVAAAGALAAGMAQVASIRKTTASGGGGGESGGGGGSVNPNAGGGQGAAPQELTVRGLDPSSLMTGASVRELAQKLLDFQRDGGTVVLK